MSDQTKFRAGAVIVAAGVGRRFGVSGLPKQYAPLGGKPLLAWSLDLFEQMAEFHAIVAVIHPNHREMFNRSIDAKQYRKLIGVVDGGLERQDSVINGLEALATSPVDVVAVHDAARPFPPRDAVSRAIAAAARDGAAILAVPVIDTIKQASPDGLIETTLDRSRLWSAQTPQIARLDLLRRALSEARAAGRQFTDEAVALESIGAPVRLIESSPANLKITLPGDWPLAEFLLQNR